MNSIFERVSVRKFKSVKITQSQIHELLRAGFSAPSARDARPWFFVVIENEDIIHQLQAFSPYAGPLATATLAVVVCADITDNPSLDYCQQDCAAATQNMLNQAKSMGLGSCWLGGYPNQDRLEKIQSFIELPEDIVPLWVIAFGVPDQAEIIKDKWNEKKILRIK